MHDYLNSCSQRKAIKAKRKRQIQNLESDIANGEDIRNEADHKRQFAKNIKEIQELLLLEKKEHLEEKYKHQAGDPIKSRLSSKDATNMQKQVTNLKAVYGENEVIVFDPERETNHDQEDVQREASYSSLSVQNTSQKRHLKKRHPRNNSSIRPNHEQGNVSRVACYTLMSVRKPSIKRPLKKRKPRVKRIRPRPTILSTTRIIKARSAQLGLKTRSTELTHVWKNSVFVPSRYMDFYEKYLQTKVEKYLQNKVCRRNTEIQKQKKTRKTKKVLPKLSARYKVQVPSRHMDFYEKYKRESYQRSLRNLNKGRGAKYQLHSKPFIC